MISYLKSLIRAELARPLNVHYSEKFPIKLIDTKKKYNFGNKNKNINFYVIKRKYQANGLFSNVAFVIDHIEFATKRKMVPVVDMENFHTVYNENNKIKGSKNAWNYYFKPISKYQLKEVYKSKNVYFSKNERLNKIPIHKYKKFINIFKTKIIIKKKLTNEANKLKKKLFKKNKIMGLHVRGTIQKIAASHMLPPQPKDLLEYSYKIFKKEKCNKLFLVTEDLNYLEIFKKFYKDKLIYLNSPRSKCNLFGDHNKHFIKYIRKNHRYKLGKEAIVDALLLSFCQILIGLESNVRDSAIVLSKLKQKNYDLITEKNSHNRFIARWKWHLKNLFPFFFGKIIIKKVDYKIT